MKVSVVSFGMGAHLEDEALLLRAFEGGVNLVETSSPESDELLGEVLREWGEPISLAVTIRRPSVAAIDETLRRLGRDRLEVVLAGDLSGEAMGALLREKEKGKIKALGADLSGPGAAREALHVEGVEVIRLPISLFDQRSIADGVLDEAEKRGLAILACSPLLDGVAVGRAERWARKLGGGAGLAQGAIRFSLSQHGVGSVLVDVRSEDELGAALKAAQAGPLPLHKVSDAAPLALDEDSLPTSGRT